MHMQLFIILINAHPYIIGREQRYCFGNFQVELFGPKDFSVMVRFSGFYDLKLLLFIWGVHLISSVYCIYVVTSLATLSLLLVICVQYSVISVMFLNSRISKT